MNIIKEFDKIVKDWKEPDFEFERHEKLIDYTSKTLKKLRTLFESAQTELLKDFIKEFYCEDEDAFTTSYVEIKEVANKYINKLK